MNGAINFNKPLHSACFMTACYMQPFISLFNCDCMELMKEYPNEYFDLAIVDPPYGIKIDKFKTMGKKGTVNITNYKQSNWDNNIPKKEYFNELFRVSKNQVIWGGNYFIEYLKNTSCVLVWDKQYIPEGFTMADIEMAWTSFNSPSKKLRVPRNKVANCISNNKQKAQVLAKIHQAQKPIDLYSFILQNYAKEGFKILDTHLGSGSSAIASHYAKCEFVGCEIDKGYFEAATARIKNETLQTAMF